MVTLSSPGFLGSSGTERLTFEQSGVDILTAAAEAVAESLNTNKISVRGLSLGGNLAASVMGEMRFPAKSAISNSAPLDLRIQAQKGWYRDYWIKTNMSYNPIENIKSIKTDIVTIYIGVSEDHIYWRE